MQAQTLFNLLYLVAFTSYILLALFIIYHIVRYSINKTVMVLTLVFFIAGTILLLFTNAVLFASIPFDTFSPNVNISAPTSAYPQNSPFK